MQPLLFFILVILLFGCANADLHCLLHYLPLLLIPTFPSRIFFVMQHAGIELGPHRYDATLLTSTLCYAHKPRIVHTTIITRVRAGEVGGAHYPKCVVHC